MAMVPLDVITLIGTLRYEKHRSVPEIHEELRKRGVVIAERTITNLLARYEELVTLHLSDQTRLRDRLASQGHIVLAAFRVAARCWARSPLGAA